MRFNKLELNLLVALDPLLKSRSVSAAAARMITTQPAMRDALMRVEWTIATPAEFDAARSDRQFNILVSDYTLSSQIPALLAKCQQAGAPCASISCTSSTAPSGCWRAATSIS